MATSDLARGAVLIGFDARERYLDWRAEWPTARRDAMLYRLDVERPLAVDEMVWRRVYGTGGWPREPLWTGPVQGYWQDLTALRRYTEEGRRNNADLPIELIAATVDLADLTAADRQAWADRLLPTRPAVIDPAWRHLGFDVADQFLLSGLTNCGLDARRDDVATLRQLWGPQLNSAHLFDGLSAARDFRRFADRQVPEHAPFFVFGLWSLDILSV